MSNGIDVLVVDDQPGVRMLLGEVLAEQGYVVDVAENGYKALDKIDSHKPRIVLMDVKMPLLNGLETIRLLYKNKNNRQPIVVLMTAYGEDEMVREAKKMDVQHFIIKPFDVNEVSQVVTDLLARAARQRPATGT